MEDVTFPFNRFALVLFVAVVCVPVIVFVYWQLLAGHADLEGPTSFVVHVFGPVLMPALTAWIGWNALSRAPALVVSSDGVEVPRQGVSVPWAHLESATAVKGAVRWQIDVAVSQEYWRQWCRDHPVRHLMLAGNPGGTFAVGNIDGNLDDVVAVINRAAERWHEAS